MWQEFFDNCFVEFRFRKAVVGALQAANDG